MRSGARHPAAAPAGAAPSRLGARVSSLGVTVAGALVGALSGGFLVVAVTLVLKAGIDFSGRQHVAFVLTVPLLGLTLATLVLYGLGTTRPAAGGKVNPWRTFPATAVRADIKSDVVECAGREERFPWRLAPIRALAILATVGTGAAMGTEAPAAYLGVAVGDAVCDRGGRWRRLIRPAALAGGAAGVGALMGIALVGTAFMLELGWRRRAPLSGERLLAALIGGVVGWQITAFFHLHLIFLVVPHEPPTDLAHAAITAVCIGLASGLVSGLAALAFHRAKKWKARPVVRLAVGGTLTLVAAGLLVRLSSAAAAVGPGGGAITWAETVAAGPGTLMGVCLLRALATAAAVAAGGCGGVFVPFLAIGDLAGRVVAPAVGVGNDVAGAAGAAGGIAGGYHLPVTAVAMALGVGGPPRSILTSIATICVAGAAGALIGKVAGRIQGARRARAAARAGQL
jgi:CIC family chloride channel protein